MGKAKVHQEPLVLIDELIPISIVITNLQIILGDWRIGFAVKQSPIAPANIDVVGIAPLCLFLFY